MRETERREGTKKNKARTEIKDKGEGIELVLLSFLVESEEIKRVNNQFCNPLSKFSRSRKFQNHLENLNSLPSVPLC